MTLVSAGSSRTPTRWPIQSWERLTTWAQRLVRVSRIPRSPTCGRWVSFSTSYVPFNTHSLPTTFSALYSKSCKRSQLPFRTGTHKIYKTWSLNFLKRTPANVHQLERSLRCSWSEIRRKSLLIHLLCSDQKPWFTWRMCHKLRNLLI